MPTPCSKSKNSAQISEPNIFYSSITSSWKHLTFLQMLFFTTNCFDPWSKPCKFWLGYSYALFLLIKHISNQKSGLFQSITTFHLRVYLTWLIEKTVLQVNWNAHLPPSYRRIKRSLYSRDPQISQGRVLSGHPTKSRLLPMFNLPCMSC